MKLQCGADVRDLQEIQTLAEQQCIFMHNCTSQLNCGGIFAN